MYKKRRPACVGQIFNRDQLRTISDRAALRQSCWWLILLLLVGVTITLPRPGYSYPITLSFKGTSGQAVPNVKIRGSRGINSLTLLVSDLNGNWTFDTNSLSALDAIIVFSGVDAGVQLTPSEIKVAELVAQGVRNQPIKAVTSAQPSTIVSWRFYSSGTTPLRDQPVSLINPQSLSCEQRLTDENGYVAWSVPRPRAKCDGLSDETGWLQIVPHEAGGTRCSNFSTYRTIGMKSCPLLGDDEAGMSAATCTSVVNPAPSLSSRIQISVQAVGSPYGVQGIELVGNSNFMALPARVTDSGGNFTFSIASVPEASATTVFEIVPISQGYEFVPRRRDSRECAFSGNNTYTCKFTAIRTFSPQGALVLDITQGGQALSGVSVVQPMAGLGCMSKAVRFSDWKGKIVVPVRRRSACSVLPDAPAWITPVALFPALNGKRFSSPADFQFCPTQLLTSAAIQAYDEGSGVQNYSITGRVVALDGGAFSGVPILMNGQEISRSDVDGRFEIFPVVQGTTAKIEARLSPYAFDPEFETFANLGRNIETVIVARAPDPLGGGIEPPTETCPVQTEYTLRGRVVDRSGAPLEGAHIYNNNQDAPSAITDSEGHFTFLVPFGSDNWITAEHQSALFSPAGRSIVETICDDDSLSFQQVDFESVAVSGRVAQADGIGVSALSMRVLVNGVPLGFPIRTAQDGSFIIAAPLGAELLIAPDSTQYDFSPSEIGPLTVEAELSNLSFIATTRPIEYPTPFPTIVPTTPEPIVTRAPTIAPIISPTAPAVTPPTSPPATITPVPTASVVPTQSPKTPEPTTAPVNPTVLPSPVVTWQPSPTALPSITPPQPHETPVATSIPELSPVPTEPPQASPEPSPAPSIPPGPPPSETSTPTVTPVLTFTAVPTQPPIATEAPLPIALVGARCGSNASSYDWVFLNTGAVDIENARWSVFDTTQPTTSFEGALFRLGAGERMEVFDTPRLGINPRFYRLMVYITDGQGRQIVLAVEPWDRSRCLQGLPEPAPTTTATPVPIESATPVATATNTPVPGEPYIPEPPVVVTPQPTAPGGSTPIATPTPINGGEKPKPIPATPAPPVATRPVQVPNETPPPSETAPPILTHTATATPTPAFEINVETRHWRNGRRMTKQLFAQLSSRGYLLVRGRAGTNFERRISLSEFSEATFDYSTMVPAGSYRITFAGRVRVVSVFRKRATSFSCTVGMEGRVSSRCRRITFALQPLGRAEQMSAQRGRAK